MPQIAPMMWFFLYMYFMASFFLVFNKIYFMK